MPRNAREIKADKMAVVKEACEASESVSEALRMIEDAGYNVNDRTLRRVFRQLRSAKLYGDVSDALDMDDDATTFADMY